MILQPTIQVMIQYDPNTGDLKMGGTIQNTALTVFILEAAKLGLMNPDKKPSIIPATEIPNGGKTN